MILLLRAEQPGAALPRRPLGLLFALRLLHRPAPVCGWARGKGVINGLAV
jgi:hypothetical protein